MENSAPTRAETMSYERALVITAATLLCGLLGECLGFLFGSLCLPRVGAGHMTLWALSWTVMGSLQGACVVPAWNLGRHDELRPWSAFLVTSGCLFTSLCALVLWVTMGRGSELSFVMALGLLLICAAPVTSYLFSRRELNVSYPAAI